MKTAPLRAIVGARVSTFSDAKVSHTAQIEAATRWATSNNAEVVGSFEDLGVSASIPPEERPELGRYLTPEGLEGWTVIVFSRLDRAFRSIRHTVDFARSMEAAGKMLVFAEDNLTLDYRPGAAKGMDAMMAELFVVLGSFFAQVELARFKERALDRHQELRTTDRWATGVPPLGFQTVDHPSGKGRALAPDTEGQKLLKAMANKLLAGESFIGIAAWLNSTNALTNMDRARIAKGKDPAGKPWTTGTVIEALTSPKTQGLKTHKGQLVLDHQGQPIRLAPATFDADTWKQLQAAAELRRVKQRQPLAVTNPLLGIGYCGCTGCAACDGKQTDGICGASLAQQVTRRTLKRTGEPVEYRSYRCGRTPLNCNGISINADAAERRVEMAFLFDWSDQQVTRQVFVPGEDNAHELEQVTGSIERLRRESDAGLIVTADDEAKYLQRMKGLIDRRTVLEATPSRAAGWTQETTGETYAEAWGEPGGTITPHQRDLLTDAQIKFVLMPDKEWGIRAPKLP